MSKTAKREFGDWGEEQASLFLINHKYNIVSRNYAGRGGEIDIIAWHRKRWVKTLCFIEVKTRRHNDGSAERATGRQKLLKLFKTAKKYCLENKIDMERTPIRFEQISVYTDENEDAKFAHYIIPVD